MGKYILLIFLIVTVLTIDAANYYVKTGGSDANTGLSDAQAWETLTKVRAFTSFAPGDSILLKSGSIFIPFLYIQNNGTVGNNIVISSYGTGSKPEIRAYGELTGWTVAANWSEYTTGIYRISIGELYINRLWINGREARGCNTLSLTIDYPWRHQSDSLYIKATSNPSAYFNSIVIPNLYDYTGFFQYNSNIEIKNLNLTGGYTNFKILTCTNITVDNCDIGYRAELYGLNSYSSGTNSVVNTIVRNCKFITGDSLSYNYDRGVVGLPSTLDAVNLGSGSVNSKVYNNYFENWSHCGVAISGGATGSPTIMGNEIYYNYITAPLIDYARGLGADYFEGSDNSFHDNTVVNTSIRNQFNGNGLKVYNNIIDGTRGAPLRSNSGQGISIEAYATPATNMEVYNNTIRNCANEGMEIWGSDIYQKSYNNIHDNNIFENDATNHIQLSIWSDLGTVNHNTFSNNHLYSSASTNTVKYKLSNIAISVSEFNLITPTNGDVISGNNNLLTVGVNATSDPNDIRIEYNVTIGILPIVLDQNYRTADNTDHTQYVLQPYSSVVLIKHDAFPSTAGRKVGMYHNKALTYHKKVLKF